MIKLQIEHWKDSMSKVRIKTTSYPNEKHGKLNSSPHSSQKIEKLYLKYNQHPIKAIRSDSITFENKSLISTFKQTPINAPKSMSELRKTASKEQIKRRKYEREVLQACSSQCISSLNMQDINPRFRTYRDPAAPPIICKAKTFNNYNELPNSRLKLVINDFIMEKDREALNYMERKIIEEVQQDQIKKDWHADNRSETLTRMVKVRKLNKTKEDKSGVKKIKSETERKEIYTSNRLQRLSIAKEQKVGMPVDYNESCGLIRAGVLLSERAQFPKSARQPMVKRVDSYNFPEPTLASFEVKPMIAEEYDKISQKEIYEQMKELDVFGKRVGGRKEKIGFPLIDLQKFQNKFF